MKSDLNVHRVKSFFKCYIFFDLNVPTNKAEYVTLYGKDVDYANELSATCKQVVFICNTWFTVRLCS